MQRFLRIASALPYDWVCNSSVGFVIMFHGYDYVSLFLPCFDIPVSLGNLFQRVASIDDRFYLARLQHIFEEN